MQGHDQGAEVFFNQVLDLVEADRDAGFSCFRGLGRSEQQLGKVHLDVAAIRRLRRIHGDLDLANGNPEDAGQPPQCPRGANRVVLRPFDFAEL
jgi:hypothetical protein